MGTNIPKVVALELKDTLQNFSLSLSSLVMKRLPTAERSQHKTKKMSSQPKSSIHRGENVLILIYSEPHTEYFSYGVNSQ